MNKLVLALFATAMFGASAVAGIGSLPSMARYALDLPYALAAAIVVLRIAHARTLVVHPKYLVLFALLFLHVLAGILLNDIGPGTVVAGLRLYFKLFPIFLIAATYDFSDKDLEKHFIFFLLVAFVQFFLALMQKWVLHLGPDRIQGTFATSSMMSMFMLWLTFVVVSVYLKKLIPLSFLLFLLPFLLFPTTLGEVKAIFIFVALGLVFIMVLSKEARRNKAQFFGILFGGVGVLVALAAGYSVFFPERSEKAGGAAGFFLEPEAGMWGYLHRGADNEIDPNIVLQRDPVVIGQDLPARENPDDWEKMRSVARLDAIIIAFKVLSRDPIQLLFGLGIGNASAKGLRLVAGNYNYLAAYVEADWTLLGHLLWETGIVGLALYVVFALVLLRDAVRVSGEPGVQGAMGLAWAAVVGVFLVTLGYKNILHFDAIMIIFLFYGGYVAATAERLRQGRRGDRY